MRIKESSKSIRFTVFLLLKNQKRKDKKNEKHRRENHNGRRRN